jgi:hypothetical protein
MVLKVGDVVEYETFMGRRTARITAVYDDVKNGTPGFDAEVPGGGQVWGYVYQVRRRLGRVEALRFGLAEATA